MPKHKNAHKKFNYDKNRRRAYCKKKKQPFIGCEAVKRAWDEHKSVKRNLVDMGLSTDPNQTLRIATTRERLTGKVKEAKSTSDVRQHKPQVIKELEIEAQAVRPARPDMADPDAQFCMYMLDKYGEDYVAMARDRRNHYQETPKQICKKIARFKNVPKLYNAYVKSKEQTAVTDV
jgi:hypothetical protein